MTLSVCKVAGRVERQRRAAGIAGALLLHAGAIACLASAHPAAVRAPGLAVGAGEGAHGVMMASLVRLPSPTVGAAGQAASTPDLMRQSRDGREQAAKAVRPAIAGSSAAFVTTTAQAGSPPSGAETLMAGQSQAWSPGEAVVADYQRRLMTHIESFKRYPEGANEAGTRGVVQLVFEINRSGGVVGVWVVKSSGFRVLDTAAVDTVRRAQPVPAIPASLPDLLTVPLSVSFDEQG